jgi:hypothetical protein
MEIKFNLNMYQPNELENELKKIKTKWEKIKGSTNFAEYTDERIKELKDLIKNKNKLEDIFLVIKASELINSLNNFDLKGKLNPELIMICTPTSDKIVQFMKLQNYFTDEEYWDNLKGCYVLQDYQSVNFEMLNALFSSNRPQKKFIMDEDEWEIFDSLPESFTIYRGMSVSEYNSKEFRFSWTLNESIAKKFAERAKMLYDVETTTHSIQVNKKDVLAYFNGREEEEIIYLKK